MDSLPHELIVNALYRLSASDISRCADVDANWQMAASDDRLFWQKFKIDKPWDRNIWKIVFPDFPRLLGSFDANWNILDEIIKPERYIQACLDTFPTIDNSMNLIVRKLRNFQTPPLIPPDFETFIHWMNSGLLNPSPVSLPKFLTYMHDLHGWPECLTPTPSQFDNSHGIYWRVIADEFARGDYPEPSRLVLADYLAKHKKKIPWKVCRKVYKHLNEAWLLDNEDIWSQLDWTAIFTSIPLSEQFLTPIMEQLIANGPEAGTWNGQTPNIAFITSHQQLSEEFIERWFADTKYDHDHIWANIYRHQNLSDAFKAKHEHRKPQPAISRLQRWANTAVEEERARYEQSFTPSATFMAKIHSNRLKSQKMKN